MLFDAHSHLADERLAPRLPALWPELRRFGVARVVVNGTGPGDWGAVRALARERPETLPCYGLHPWFLATSPPDWFERLEPFVLEGMGAGGPRPSPPPVPVGIGEIGLERNASGVGRAAQREAFTRQLALAARWNLPASIHCVRAWGAMGEILRSQPLPERGVLLHAYGGPAEMLGPLLKRGAYFSFSGHHLARSPRRESACRECFRRIPADRLLVETDAPDGGADAGEEPRRYASRLRALYAALAALRGEPPDVLEARVAENFQRLFGEG